MIAPPFPSRPLDDDRLDDADRLSNRNEPGASNVNFVQQTIAKHPTLALAAAGAIGLTLGWLVKRKWR
ncbi:hypothetical protein Enr13x_01560 [Stieleria neptunia]|uniref:Uncharacterized protein n=1 Tax=Stieleria neptunia TaxID=2527979 RepID=A0A518HHP9_9BACT|nr:hypothetical protein [Stieleria neptunia]QDV40350.1 hypothetical protein Enr13x_01560 [Stieleria neptunia]